MAFAAQPFAQTIELSTGQNKGAAAPQTDGSASKPTPIRASVSGKVVFIDEDGFFRLGDFPELLFLVDVEPVAKNSFDIIKGWYLDCLITDFKIGDPAPPRRVFCTADKASAYGVSLFLVRRKLAVYRRD